MGLTAKDSGGKDYKPAPAGTHIARCCWVIDLGTQTSDFGSRHQVLLGWELPNELLTEGDRIGEPCFMSKFYTLSLHEKANLRHDLEAWRGKEFTPEELDGFDVRKLASKPCQLTIIHKETDGKVRARIASVASLPRGMSPDALPAQINETRIYEIDNPDAGEFHQLPEWVQRKINESAEVRDAGPHVEPEPDYSSGYGDAGEDIPF